MDTRTYKKKPVEIEAMQFTADTASDVREWLWAHDVSHAFVCIDINNCDAGHVINITTLEGVMTASEGDYVIKGIKGEFYPCKPDIFEATYEAVEPDPGGCNNCNGSQIIEDFDGERPCYCAKEDSQ